MTSASSFSIVRVTDGYPQCECRNAAGEHSGVPELDFPRADAHTRREPSSHCAKGEPVRMLSERLARECFEAGRDHDFPRRFKELLHPEVAVAVKSADGEWVEGADAVGELLDRNSEAPVFEATDERYVTLDDERVVVEGRLRWMDEGRTLRDEPAIWALEFRDGLLYRSVAVRSVAEAEAFLTAGRTSSSR